MGYNGSNRKGYDRRYRGLSKSSMRRGNSILFGRNGLLTVLLDILFSVIKDINNTSKGHNIINIETKEIFNFRFSKSGIPEIIIVSILGLSISSFFISLYFWAGYWMFFSYLLSSFGFAITLFAASPIFSENDKLDYKLLLEQVLYKIGFSVVSIIIALVPCFIESYDIGILVSTLLLINLIGLLSGLSCNVISLLICLSKLKTAKIE